MPRYLLLIGNLLLLLVCSAQIDEIKLNSVNHSEILITSDFADVHIITYDGNEVLIKTEVNIDDGKQNNLLKLKHQESGKRLMVDSYIQDYQKIPKRKKVFDHDGQIIEVSDFFYEHAVSRGNWQKGNYSVKIEDKVEVKHIIKIPVQIATHVNLIYGNLDYEGKLVTGSQLSSTYGTVDVSLDQLKAPLIVESGYNCVDVAIMPNLSFDLKMNSQYGECFTDLDLNFIPQTKGKAILASLNGGGMPLNLRSPYNNIYLRSKK